MMNNKRRIQLGGVGLASTTDRLSQLPDAILDHILSFVDTKTVVQTCVLSRRWRSVWKHVPALYLNCASFGFSQERFTRFVDKVLSLRHPLKVNEISYHNGEDYSSGVDPSEVDPLVVRVVEYAVSHGTSHLRVCLDYDLSITNGYRFSDSYSPIFEYDLETLSLWCSVIDDRFQTFCFRALTDIRLFACDFRSDQELLDPFSKFPCLKNLVLDTPYMNFNARLRISGPQLHDLKLLDTNVRDVEIAAPKLKFLTLHEVEVSLEFAELDLPSLDHADIQFFENHIADDHHGGLNITKEDWDFMFQGCHNAKSLTLCNSIIKALCKISDFLEQRPCPFTRLETLNLRMKPKNIPYKVMSYFFKGSSCAAPSINII